MKTAGKKKFVTGATGYVGERLVRSLAEHGHTVYALSRKETSLFAGLENVIIIVGDISDFELPDDVDTIYHAAGVIHDEKEMERVNVLGTKRVIDLCIKNDSLLVYLGSAGIVGPTRNAFIDEMTPCHPHNAYEISKYAAERLVVRACENGLQAHILRPTTIFGEHMNPDQSFMALIRSMRSGLYKQIGTGIYNAIHVDEVVRALESLDDVLLPNAATYIINDPISYESMDEIIKNVPPVVIKKTLRIPYPVALAVSIFLSVVTLITGKKNPLTFSRLRALTNTSVYSDKKIRDEIAFASLKTTARHITEVCEDAIARGTLS